MTDSASFFLWEGQHEPDEDVINRCVEAEPESFQLAAGMLLQWALSFPPQEMSNEIDRALTIPSDAYRNRDRLIQVARQLMGSVPCGEGGEELSYELRMHPTNPCTVQQSLDGGATWTTAFTFDCFDETKAVNNTNYVNNSTKNYYEQITNLTEIYEGDVTNIYPDAEYGDDEDDNRDIALCYAVKRAVDTVCEAFILAIDERNKNVGLAGLAVGAAVGLFILGVFLTAGGLALGAAAITGATAGSITLAGAITAITAWVNDVASRHNREPFLDLEARAEVVCYWFEAMQGQTLSFTLYSEALQPPVSLDGVALLIANEIHIGNQITENFVGFANLARNALAGVQSGVISAFDCPCLDESCKDTVQATILNGAFVSGSAPHTRFARATSSGGIAQFAIYFPGGALLQNFSFQSQSLVGGVSTNHQRVELWFEGELILTPYTRTNGDGAYVFAPFTTNNTTGAGLTFDEIRFFTQKAGSISDVDGQVCVTEL